METYITKKGNDTLTRVSLEVGTEKFIIESVYSDTNTMELLMQCIEGFCASHRILKKEIFSTIKELTDNKVSSFNNTSFITSTVSITIEQYDTRVITSKLSETNLLRTIMDCFVAANVQKTWLESSVFQWLQEYVDENEK